MSDPNVICEWPQRQLMDALMDQTTNNCSSLKFTPAPKYAHFSKNGACSKNGSGLKICSLLKKLFSLSKTDQMKLRKPIYTVKWDENAFDCCRGNAIFSRVV